MGSSGTGESRDFALAELTAEVDSAARRCNSSRPMPIPIAYEAAGTIMQLVGPPG
jgi:hypothetical protein